MIHGGDIYRNQIDLDYSVNINPYGIPESVENALQEAVSCCIQYPDPEQEQLKKAIASFEQVDSDTILAGNGASELFVAVEHALKPKKIVIPVPSFYGYQQAAEVGDAEIIYVQLEEKNQFVLDQKILSVLTADVDLLYLANPNNPTGQMVPIDLLEQIIFKCEKEKIYVVLDECFLPFCEQQNAYQQFYKKNYFPHLIQIRAFTKTFAIPGVRLGYLICKNQNLHQAINKQLPEWNLSVFAQMAGVAAAKETEFLERTSKEIRLERRWMEQKLKEIGFLVYPSEANYILFSSDLPLYEMMLNRNILIRDCSNYRGLPAGFYRIAVKQRAENKQLIQIMKEEIENICRK